MPEHVTAETETTWSTCPCGCPVNIHIGEIGCPCGLPDELPCSTDLNGRRLDGWWRAQIDSLLDDDIDPRAEDEATTKEAANVDAEETEEQPRMAPPISDETRRRIASASPTTTYTARTAATPARRETETDPTPEEQP